MVSVRLGVLVLGGAISDGGGDSLRAELVSRLRARLRRARRGRLAGSGQGGVRSGGHSLCALGSAPVDVTAQVLFFRNVFPDNLFQASFEQVLT